ncbi:hypothetical protein SDC9_167094 [bioreactor metagenome]|uniref:YidE/YbjL duplication domain-containing protein n=1 Tax=bioreactor metagenome TaxID=1076179 RepID=A0A645G1B6_9ZZZZ
MFEILESYPLLLLTLLVVVGSLLGQIKIAGATLGPAAVLFTAIGLTAWGVSNGVELTSPKCSAVSGSSSSPTRWASSPGRTSSARCAGAGR